MHYTSLNTVYGKAPDYTGRSKDTKHTSLIYKRSERKKNLSSQSFFDSIYTLFCKLDCCIIVHYFFQCNKMAWLTRKGKKNYEKVFFIESTPWYDLIFKISATLSGRLDRLFTQIVSKINSFLSWTVSLCWQMI